LAKLAFKRRLASFSGLRRSFKPRPFKTTGAGISKTFSAAATLLAVRLAPAATWMRR
jgi:hypothetical protein